MAVGIPVELVLDTGDGDLEQTEEELQYLLAELSELELPSIDRVTRAPAPAGTRGGDAIEVGALLIGLGGSGALLPVLLGLVQDWLSRRQSGNIRMKIGDDELELTAASDEMQRRALEEFLRRHGE
ncbi:effector-associated constant component EACC1 [Streptomyces mirabilis]